MVDYKAIADVAVTYADADAAFAAMSVETVQGKYRELDGSDLRIWAGNYSADYTALKAAAAVDVVAEMAAILIQTPDSKLDLNKAAVRAMLDGLVTAGVISVAGKDYLYSEAAVMEPKWAGLKLGHVNNALHKRANGEV